MFNREKVLDAVQRLPWRRGLAFGACCCHRLVPTYEAYCEHDAIAPDPIVSATHEALWRIVLDVQPDALNIAAEDIERVVIDDEHSKSVLCFAAANAITAIKKCESFFKGHDLRLLVDTAEICYSTIDDYVSKVDFPLSKRFAETALFSRWVETHPLIHEELERQDQDIELLSKPGEMDKSLVNVLRRNSAKCGICPWDRGIVLHRSG